MFIFFRMTPLKPDVCPTLTASQFGPATLQVLNRHVWLVATVLGGTLLHYFSNTLRQTLAYLHPSLFSPLKRLAPMADTLP